MLLEKTGLIIADNGQKFEVCLTVNGNFLEIYFPLELKVPKKMIENGKFTVKLEKTKNK
jgi:hypothetical protein